MNNFSRPVVCGIFPRSKSFDNSISREKTTSRSRSPLNRSPRTTEIFFTPPTSPSVPHNQSPFKTPPTSPSPQHRASSPVHSWEDVTKREVYLKCESDFSNPNGAMSSLLLSGSSKARDVFLFPSKQLTSSERDKHTVKFTAKLNHLRSPNKDEKAKAVLSRVALMPQCESEKIKVVDQQWAKNLQAAVQHLPLSSLDRGFDNSVQLTDSQRGPRVPKLSTIYETHTPENSLRIERYLKLCKLRITQVLKITYIFFLFQLYSKLVMSALWVLFLWPVNTL